MCIGETEKNNYRKNHNWKNHGITFIILSKGKYAKNVFLLKIPKEIMKCSVYNETFNYSSVMGRVIYYWSRYFLNVTRRWLLISGGRLMTFSVGRWCDLSSDSHVTRCQIWQHVVFSLWCLPAWLNMSSVLVPMPLPCICYIHHYMIYFIYDIMRCYIYI